MERRYTTVPVRVEREHRVGTDPAYVISGYAAVFYVPGDAGTVYRLDEDVYERILPSCFTRTLQGNPTVHSYFNHNPDLLLANSASGTLELSVDKVGLYFRAKVPDTQAGRDVLTLVRRGDVTGSSFAFTPYPDGVVLTHSENGYIIRELRSVELFECGPVARPAFTGTSVGVGAGRANPRPAPRSRSRGPSRSEIMARARIVQLQAAGAWPL